MIHAVFHKICEIERSKKAKMTFKVTKGRRYCATYDVVLVFYCNYVSILRRFRDMFPKIERGYVSLNAFHSGVISILCMH